MPNQTDQNKFLKTLLVLIILVWGAFSAVREVYLPEDTAILPSEQRVLAASGFRSVENTLPAVRTNPPQVSTVSAAKTDNSNFEVVQPVLMYHRIRDVLLVADRSDIEFSVPPSSLEEQLQYLQQENFQTISLSELNASFENKTPLPPKSVILTFDDGFRDFYTNAFPLLKKYNMRAAVFYVAGYSNFPGYMDLQMLREVHNSGLVDVQPHSMSHLLLTKLSPEQQRQEIFESKRILEEVLGKKTNFFAYPYGDFDQNILNLINEAGFKLGFGTTAGLVLRQSQKLTLPRTSVSGFDDLKRFILKLGVKTEEVLPKESLAEPREKATTTSSAVKDQ